WFHLPDDEKWALLREKKLNVRRTVLTEPLQRATEEYLRESRGRSESNRKANALYVQLIALYIQRELPPDRAANAASSHVLDRLESMINEDLARDWNVETMAKELGVSQSHLHRLVQEHFRTSPMKLVTRLRMERAQEWLIMHDSPQGVIGEMVGYQNEFAFLVAFKRFSGVTPKQFRRRR
ncbi:MAG: AraC family transcriptional regulator, partial [Candidatus Hydrogenedentes bacterium]|nr:AraC family transcriptional regulator [Candidatus Hydrogenedentota bacterium]